MLFTSLTLTYFYLTNIAKVSTNPKTLVLLAIISAKH